MNIFMSACCSLFNKIFFNEKDFVKLATAGRHKNVYVIYVKHNLFQQSKQSRTIDLNTT